MLGLSCGAFAAEGDKPVSNAIVDFLPSDRDISQFLNSAALKWDKYFSRITGECNDSYISIRIDTNGKYDTFNEIQKATHDLAAELALSFPLYTGQVDVFPSDSEKTWNFMSWQIKDGQIISYQEN